MKRSILFVCVFALLCAVLCGCGDYRGDDATTVTPMPTPVVTVEPVPEASPMITLNPNDGAVKDTDPASDKAQALVKKLQDHISAHFYTCTGHILSGLGKMYAAGGEFTQNIDAYGGEGTAVFASKSIEHYCMKKS